jgi:hypothetical protein
MFRLVAALRKPLLAALMLATLAGGELVPWLEPCPLQSRPAAIGFRSDLRAGIAPARPPSDTGYDCPLYDRQSL